ncbi:MAG: hypothetical protein LAN62_04385 [Acidobacteriia bacterium]|nr:hypothetical protein [Terriglobia bacterium]
MACINADGTLSDSAKLLLRLLEGPVTAEEIAARLGRPMFWIRASLRELVGADLVRAESAHYVITERGREKL